MRYPLSKVPPWYQLFWASKFYLILYIHKSSALMLFLIYVHYSLRQKQKVCVYSAFPHLLTISILFSWSKDAITRHSTSQRSARGNPTFCCRFRVFGETTIRFALRRGRPESNSTNKRHDFPIQKLQRPTQKTERHSLRVASDLQT